MLLAPFGQLPAVELAIVACESLLQQHCAARATVDAAPPAMAAALVIAGSYEGGLHGWTFDNDNYELVLVRGAPGLYTVRRDE